MIAEEVLQALRNELTAGKLDDRLTEALGEGDPVTLTDALAAHDATVARNVRFGFATTGNPMAAAFVKMATGSSVL